MSEIMHWLGWLLNIKREMMEKKKWEVLFLHIMRDNIGKAFVGIEPQSPPPGVVFFLVIRVITTVHFFESLV